jgi:hypothetical protein
MRKQVVVAIASFVCWCAPAVLLMALSCLLGAPLSSGQAITPVNGGQVASPRVTINNGPGDQTEPHVSGNLAAYTDFSTGNARIHYFNFLTGSDLTVPAGAPGEIDTLSSVNGNRIAFSRQSLDRRATIVFDTLTLSFTEIDPHPGSSRFATAIGGNTLAFVDAEASNGQILAYDLAANPPVPPVVLEPSATKFEGNPKVAPEGNTIVWEDCNGSFTVCNIFKAVRLGGIWTTSPVTNTLADVNVNPHTDGTWIAYDSNRTSATGNDIYFQPVGGGPERQLVIAGIQRNPSMSQGVIAFESQSTPGSPADLFVYVMATNTLYKVTSTPLIDESLNDVSVLPNGDIRVVWAANDDIGGGSNVYATTFTPAPANLPLTVTASNATQTYGAATPAFGVTYTGFLNGDTAAVLGGTLMCTTTATPASPVGNYAIACSGQTSSSYAITYAPGTLTITPVPLTMTASNAARAYGASNPVLTGTVIGLQNADPITASFTTTAGPASLVGSYTITASVFDPSNRLGNYSLSLINSTLMVVQEPTTLSVTLSPLSIIVGQSSLATVTLTAPDMVIPIDPSVLAPLTLSSPVVSDILSNNGLCAPVPSAAPGVASCIFAVTSVEPNGRTLNASFAGSPDLAASSATGGLIVTAALETQKTCLNSDFRNVAVPGGSYLWFNSIFKVKDVTKHKITITFFQSSVQFQYRDTSQHVVTVNQAIPDAKIVIDPSVTVARTTFDGIDNVWITTVPFDLDDAAFLNGMPWLVPAGGIPGDIEPVSFCGTFASDTADLDIGWRWAAAAYSSFSSDNSVLGVKPMFTDHDNPGTNRDLAGTPENFKQFVIPGARGKGGKNYTGTYSRSAFVE